MAAMAGEAAEAAPVWPVPALTTLLVLADGRLPAGGHAHSGGLEAAVADGRVRDLSTLEAFLLGRLATAGLVAASFAAATTYRLSIAAGTAALSAAGATNAWATADAAPGGGVHELDAGLDARTPSPALRTASRAQGRALLRAGRAMWTLPPLAYHPDGPHQSVAQGVVAAAASLSPAHVALVAAYGSVSGPASAAIRLLALDPYPVHALLARLAPACDETAWRAASYAGRDEPDLPALSAPLLDISAEDHSTWEVRLFAS